MTELSWAERLRSGFRRTSDRFGDNITGLFGKAALDDQSLGALEDGRIAAGPRARFGANLPGLFGKAALDDQSLDELEEGLIASDLGPATAAKIRERLAGERFERGVTEGGAPAGLQPGMEGIP